MGRLNFALDVDEHENDESGQLLSHLGTAAGPYLSFAAWQLAGQAR